MSRKNTYTLVLMLILGSIVAEIPTSRLDQANNSAYEISDTSEPLVTHTPSRLNVFLASISHGYASRTATSGS
jgi:hypothetical protein